MKRERPPMPPLAVRVKVAERQARENPSLRWGFYLSVDWSGQTGKQLKTILRILFPDPATKFALDHDPALILRPYNPRIKDVATRYTPHAHDPDALIYREKADHQQKTTGRRPGAERTITTKGSDIGLKAKFARLERKEKRPKRKIQSRGFQKGVNRRLTGRPFRA